VKPIATAIHTKLGSVISAGSFHALLSGRYYHVEAPQNTAFPLAVWTLEGIDNEDQFDGSRIMRGTVSFDIYAEAKAGAATVMDIEEALFTLLDQSTLTVAGGVYGNATLQCLARGTPTASDEFVIISVAYSLFSTRTT